MATHLIVVNVINDLLQQGLVRKETGHWQIEEELPNVSASVPNTLWQAIERQIERLPAKVTAPVVISNKGWRAMIPTDNIASGVR